MMIGLTFVGIMTFFQLSYKALLEKIRIGGRNLRNFIKTKMTSFKEKQIKRKASKENAKKSKNNPKNKEETDNEIPVNGKLSKPVDNEKSDSAEVEDTRRANGFKN